MSEFFFVLKTMIFAILLILCLQIKIGKTTLEQRSLEWMHQSAAIEALRGVADGAVIASGEGYQWAKSIYEKHALGSEPKHSRHVNSDKDKKRADDAVELD
jgi:hypothetical protein